jgi:hypothetical protein
MEYSSGVCNIDYREQKKRYFLGSAGFASAGALVILHYFNYILGSPGFILPLLLFVGFNGFIQGRKNFCAGYGFLGKQNADGSGPESVPEDSRRRDLLEAVRIQLYSLFGALSLYGAYVFLAVN